MEGKMDVRPWQARRPKGHVHIVLAAHGRNLSKLMCQKATHEVEGGSKGEYFAQWFLDLHTDR